MNWEEHKKARWGMAMLVDYACETWGLTRAQVLGPCKAHYIVRPRQMLMWFAANHYGFSTTAIGRAIHRDHTTVMHGIRKAQELLATDTTMYELWESFDRNKPSLSTVTLPPVFAVVCPIRSISYSHTVEESKPADVPIEATIDVVIADHRPVIDEAAMMRRRMAGRA